MRIVQPNYTQTPNDLFDYWLPLLRGSELKILLIMIRKTFGWHKARDKISLSQFEQATGLDRKSVSACIESLQEKGVIKREIIGIFGKEESFYELIIYEEKIPEEGEGNIPLPTSREFPPPPVGKFPSQKKELNKSKQIREEREGAEAPTPPISLPSSISSKDVKECRALHVETTQEEHNKLLGEHGESHLQACYQHLSDWKQDTPKSRWKKSDYRSIGRWVSDAVKENQRKKINPTNSKSDLSRHQGLSKDTTPRDPSRTFDFSGGSK